MTSPEKKIVKCDCGTYFHEEPPAVTSPQTGRSYCCYDCYYKYESSAPQSLRGAPFLKCPSCDRQFDVSYARSDQWRESSQTWHCSKTCADAWSNARALRNTRRCECCGKYACDGRFTVGQRVSERLACSPECAETMAAGRPPSVEEIVYTTVDALRSQATLPRRAAVPRPVKDAVASLLDMARHEGSPLEELSKLPDRRYVCVDWVRDWCKHVIKKLEEIR